MTTIKIGTLILKENIKVSIYIPKKNQIAKESTAQKVDKLCELLSKEKPDIFCLGGLISGKA